MADITANTAIGAPLLSRFDLVLILMDRADANWDRVVSSFVLGQSVQARRTCYWASCSPSPTSCHRRRVVIMIFLTIIEI
jgi:hypothetical protein